MKKILIVILIIASLSYGMYHCTQKSENIQIPYPTGQFGVGTTFLHLIDKNRKETHDITSDRELMIQVYYPITKNLSDNYEPYLGKKHRICKTGYN